MLTWWKIVEDSAGGLGVSGLEGDQVFAGSQLELGAVLWSVLDSQL